MAMTQAQSQQVSQLLWEQLQDPNMQKEAIDAINDFTRTTMREDGFMRRIMEPQEISNDELDRQLQTDKPIKIIDKEPNGPPAMSVPFGQWPTNYYIRGPKYAVTFSRIQTDRFVKDNSELRTWVMDIRQVLSDNAIKDMMHEEDSKFIAAVNTALGGSQGATTPTSGSVQWQGISGGITRDTVMDALAVMPATPFRLESQTILLNNVTVYQLLKWGRDETGGDLSEQLLRSGFTEANFLNRRWLISLKQDLIPNNTFYFFAHPKFIGKTFELEPVQMYLERKAFLLSWFMWEEIGASIGHTGGLTRVDFTS